MFFNAILVPTVIAAGGFFLLKMRFFYLRHPLKTVKLAVKGDKTADAVSSLMLALAGTLGVGNILGVAVGISVGGVGSVFWLVLSALFSSALKYSEVFLSCLSGKGNGMIGVIKDSYRIFGGILAKMYAFLCIILSLSMGSFMQAAAIHDVSGFTDKSNIAILSICSTSLLALICALGKRRIKSSVGIIIPLATVIYSGLCLTVILRNAASLPRVISEIALSALSPKSALGGIAGFLAKSGMKEGFARGLLSNEAGAGTSSFSHTALDSKSAARAGAFGIIEVAFDTLLLCPLTALALLSSGVTVTADASSVLNAFYLNVGSCASYLLFFSTVAFALSTSLCWYYYGEVCREEIFGKSAKKIYYTAFILSFFIGICKESSGGIRLTDFVLLALCLITVSTLLKRSDDIKPPSF